MRVFKIKTFKIKEQLCLGAEKMAQLGKCLPHKHEGLRLSPRIHIQKAGGNDKHLSSQFWGRRDKQIPEVCWPASPA